MGEGEANREAVEDVSLSGGSVSVQPTRGWVGPGFRDRLVTVLVWLLSGLCSRRFRRRAQASSLTLLDRFAGADAQAGKVRVTVQGCEPADACRYCGRTIHYMGEAQWWSDRGEAWCSLAPQRGQHYPIRPRVGERR